MAQRHLTIKVVCDTLTSTPGDLLYSKISVFNIYKTVNCEINKKNVLSNVMLLYKHECLLSKALNCEFEKTLKKFR